MEVGLPFCLRGADEGGDIRDRAVVAMGSVYHDKVPKHQGAD